MSEMTTDQEEAKARRIRGQIDGELPGIVIDLSLPYSD